MTQEIGGRPVWEMLKGGTPQQRVWTFGNSLTCPSSQAAGAEGAGQGRHTSQYPLPVLEGRVITSVAAGVGEIRGQGWGRVGLGQCSASEADSVAWGGWDT